VDNERAKFAIITPAMMANMTNCKIKGMTMEAPLINAYNTSMVDLTKINLEKSILRSTTTKNVHLDIAKNSPSME
jgi:hypothetical protein